MTRAYYNELDPLKAETLREAIRAGAIAPGDVDERSVADVQPGDLAGYTQCHFFAGGGFWSLALRLARWPDDRPVWTGSCPCPSFSAAGKGLGFGDPRHLWPHWFRLIEERQPAVVFGEQVNQAIGHGWLDLVHSDLETQNYAVGAAVLGACSVGAPHIRQRLYFVADAGSRYEPDRFEVGTAPRGVQEEACERQRIWPDAGDGRDAVGVEHPEGLGRGEGRAEPAGEQGGPAAAGTGYSGQLGDAHHPGPQGQRRRAGSGGGELAAGAPGAAERVADADGGDPGAEGLQRGREHGQLAADGGTGGVADHHRLGWERRQGRAAGDDSGGQTAGWLESDGGPVGGGETGAGRHQVPGPVNGWWRDADWIGCRDGKFRPVGPGTFPLAHGSPARVGRLRLYGDGIVVQAAQAFIESYLEIGRAS